MKANLGEASPRYRALMQLLRTADTLWGTSHAFFDRWDLGPSQFNVLNLLHLNPDGLSQSDLSRQLIMHRSNVTGLVDRLEKRGLVERREVTGDRRAYRVVLTATGTKVMRDVLPRYYEGADRVLRHLSAPRAAQLTKDLAQVAESAERIATEVKK